VVAQQGHVVAQLVKANGRRQTGTRLVRSWLSKNLLIGIMTQSTIFQDARRSLLAVLLKPHRFYAAPPPAPCKNFDADPAAPAPTLL
jgi:hypothetical protein